MYWIVSENYTNITKKLNAPNLRLTLFNNLFIDDDDTIYLVPRNYIKDDFTNPLGDNAKYVPFSADLHDVACDFHAIIKVDMSFRELRRRNYIKEVEGELYCADIPKEFLKVIPVTKWEADCLFKRAMKASGLNWFTIAMYRTGVFFNVGWLGKREPINLDKLYTTGFNTSKKLKKVAKYDS